MTFKTLTFLFTILFPGLCSGSETNVPKSPIFHQTILNRTYTQTMEQHGNPGNIKTVMGLLQDAAYLGIMKSYRVSSKMQGTMLVGYNFLNDKTKISSPWIVRLGWKL